MSAKSHSKGKVMSIKALAAEFFGTLWLVLGGCGSAVLAALFFAGDENIGIGLLGVSIAFGLTVVTGAYAFGHVSGGHFNPAVTIGLVIGGRFELAKAGGYIVAQVVGAIVGTLIIFLTASGMDMFEIDNTVAGAFASNGYGELSPGGFGLGSALLIEIVLTAIFLIVILGVTERRGAPAFGGLTIGLTLALIHLVSIPVTNTSVNPARSTSQAIFTGGDYIPQLWLFWVAPIVGAIIGAVIHLGVLSTDDDPAFA